MSNWSLAHLSNVRFKTVATAINLVRKYRFTPHKLLDHEKEIMREFQQSGATIADWSTTDARQLLYDAVLDTSQTKGKGYISEAGKWLEAQVGATTSARAVALARGGGKVAATIHNSLVDLYAAGDNVFRLAAFMTKMGELRAQNTMTREEMIDKAGAYAQEVFLNYDIDARALQVAKHTFLPFASFTYAASKRLAAVARDNPWKIAELALVYQVVSMAALAATGDSDEEDERKRKRDKKGISYIRLPSAPGQTNYMELARWLPTPMALENKGSNGFLGISWYPQSLTPNGPVISLLAAASGVNLYTGKPIHKELDTTSMKVLTVLTEAGKSMTPAWIRKSTGYTTDSKGLDPNPAVFLAGTFVAPVTGVNDVSAQHNREQRIKAVDRAYSSEKEALKRQYETRKIDAVKYRNRGEELKARYQEAKREAGGRP
jgi:hypothetical protein